tara:strand:- start:275 stop:436 length:162 start_codon:yes stop_codon:yes gene_type:complete
VNLKLQKLSIWLEIIEELGLADEKLINLCLNEANEFLAIFTTISNKLNSKLVQ